MTWSEQSLKTLPAATSKNDSFPNTSNVVTAHLFFNQKFCHNFNLSYAPGQTLQSFILVWREFSKELFKTAGALLGFGSESNLLLSHRWLRVSNSVLHILILPTCFNFCKNWKSSRQPRHAGVLGLCLRKSGMMLLTTWCYFSDWLSFYRRTSRTGQEDNVLQFIVEEEITLEVQQLIQLASS